MNKEIIKALKQSEAFLIGFEDDETQGPSVRSLLQKVRKSIAEIEKEVPVKVLVTIEGGICQSVITNNENCEIVIIDYDKNGDDPVVISGIQEPNEVVVNMYDLFVGVNDPDEKFVHEELKRLKF